MLTPKERRDMEDQKAELQRKDAEIKEMKRKLRELRDAAENFVCEFGEIKRGRRGVQSRALRYAADKFEEAFTLIKAHCYKMPG